jgi:hypothetical protein
MGFRGLFAKQQSEAADVRFGSMLLIKSTISRAVLKFGFLLVVCLPLPLESDWQLTLNATNAHVE